MRQPEQSLRLGKRVGPRGPFSADIRMPDWHIDADPATTAPTPNPLPGFPPIPGVPYPAPLFPEEGIGVDLSGATPGPDIPFTITNFDSASAPSTGWMGGVVPTSGPLAELAKAARNYNSALYLLRLYYYAFDHGKTFTPFPPAVQNPHGPKFSDGTPIPLPPHPLKEKTKFDQYAKEAERAWNNAAISLNALLEAIDPSTGLMEVYADMIQVNGYIISFRVVRPLFKKPIHFTEISGSSSHVSIDYPFSSTP